ncbi:MAG: ribosomal protein S18-alanine N-acetyltransferase [Myxococcota bacterium]
MAVAAGQRSSQSIRRYAPGDLDQVLAIEQVSYPNPWTREMFAEELNNRLCHIFVCREEDREDRRVLGYICFWLFLGEMHLLNVSVDPALRRRGVGRSLLVHALDFSAARGAKVGFLEVRRSNRGARALYAQYGFAEVGVRPRYYEDGEDALVMLLEITS